MTLTAVNPYLILDGKTEQAIAFYQRSLGAKVEALQRFGDVDPNCPAEMKSRVMHARLRVGGSLLMMGDSGPAMGAPPRGGSVHLALSFDDPEQARLCFDALAVNGQVGQPLGEAPWGGLFGAIDDEFGIQWMFNSVSVKKTA